MNFKEVESFLTNIKSVISCKIIADSNDTINEIHVLSDSSRHTKQISRDIRSTLLSYFNIDIDYKIISVAQIEKNLSVNTDYRLKYEGYTSESTSDRIKISVKLTWDEKEYIGISEGIKSEKNTLKIAATATLEAIKNAINYDCFLVEDVQATKLAGSDVIVTAITFVTQNKEYILTGSSIIVNNILDSTIKSTLNAVNRRVCIFISE